MNDRLKERRRALGEEYEKGLRKLAELDRERRELESTLLRISGAIQVLDELSREVAEPIERSPELKAVAK